MIEILAYEIVICYCNGDVESIIRQDIPEESSLSMGIGAPVKIVAVNSLCRSSNLFLALDHMTKEQYEQFRETVK